MQWYKVVWTLVLLSVCLCSLLAAAQQERPYWENSGCHLVGYSKYVQVPGCRKTKVDMNACRGYCLTYSLLATYDEMTSSRRFSSRGNCCSIQDTHEVIVILQCENNERRLVSYRSAASCSCTLCAQDDPSTANLGIV